MFFVTDITRVLTPNLPIPLGDRWGNQNDQIFIAVRGTRYARVPFTRNVGQRRHFNGAFKGGAMQSKCLHEKLRRQRPKVLNHLRR